MFCWHLLGAGDLVVLLEDLQERTDPLADNVTADLGASQDGLLYLQVMHWICYASRECNDDVVCESQYSR